MKIYTVDFGFPFHDKEQASNLLADLKPIAIDGKISLDYCLIFKIKEDDWPKIVEVAAKYDLGAQVIRAEDDGK